MTAFAGVLLAAVATAAGFDVGKLQAEIDAASAKGGGTVVVPPGAWETGPLKLRSNVTLRLEKGATLLGTADKEVYKRLYPKVRAVVHAMDAENVAIEGEGTIDGQGGAMPWTGTSCPHLVNFQRCRNVRVEGVTLRNGGTWTLYCLRCDGVVYRRVKVWAHVNHCEDGMDIASRNVLVEDCSIDSDDDALAFKTPEPDVVVENVEVRNCRLASGCNSIHLGTESFGTLRNVSIHDCVVAPPSARGRFDWRREAPGVTEYLTGLCGISIMCMDGERLEDVTIRNLEMEGPMTPVFIRFDRRHEAQPGRPACLRNVLIENVRATARSRVACAITGVPGLRPSGIVLRNVDLTLPGGGTAADFGTPVPEKERGTGAPASLMFDHLPMPAYGFYVRHADGVRFENVKTRYASREERPAVFVDDADVAFDAACAFAAPEGGAPKVFTLKAENRDSLTESYWKSFDTGTGYFRTDAPEGGPKPPLIVCLGRFARDRETAATLFRECRRRKLAALVPFGGDVASVLKAVDAVADRVDRRQVFLKGDGGKAALAAALLVQDPKRWAGVSAVALSGTVPARLADARGVPLDIVIAAGDADQVKAGTAAFNGLVGEADRIPGDTVRTIAETGRVPEGFRYDGPTDPDFLPPGRWIAMRREAGDVRLTVVGTRGVRCFDPSIVWFDAVRARRFTSGGTATVRLDVAGWEDPFVDYRNALHRLVSDIRLKGREPRLTPPEAPAGDGRWLAAVRIIAEDDGVALVEKPDGDVRTVYKRGFGKP